MLWPKADTLPRNLHTIGEFFPSRSRMFSIWNTCSRSPTLIPRPACQRNSLFNILNKYSML